MLNWIAVWIGVWVFNLGSPLQNDNPSQVDVPVSNDIVEGAKLPVFWGDPVLQGLHVGLFIALAGLLVFWVLLNRTTTGFEVRAVGFNPDAARRLGHLRRAQLHPRDGGLRRVRGAGGDGRSCSAGGSDRDQRHPAQPDRRSSASRSRCSGRNTAIGVLFSALLFGGADHRDVGAQPRSDGVRARAGHEPHLHDPGDGRAVRLH